MVWGECQSQGVGSEVHLKWVFSGIGSGGHSDFSCSEYFLQVSDGSFLLCGTLIPQGRAQVSKIPRALHIAHCE